MLEVVARWCTRLRLRFAVVNCGGVLSLYVLCWLLMLSVV